MAKKYKRTGKVTATGAPTNYIIKFLDDGIIHYLKSKKTYVIGQVVQANYKNIGKFKAEIIGIKENEDNPMGAKTGALGDSCLTSGDSVGVTVTVLPWPDDEIDNQGDKSELAEMIIDGVDGMSIANQLSDVENAAKENAEREMDHVMEEVATEKRLDAETGKDNRSHEDNAELVEKKKLKKEKRIIHKCIFCQEDKKRIVQHYRKSHKNEPQVRKIASMTSSVLRNREWRKLTGEGDFYFSSTSLDLTSKTHKTCSHCLRQFKNQNIKKHIKICSSGLENDDILPPILSHDETGYVVEILGKVRTEAIRKMIEEDKYIKAFGFKIWEEKCYEKNEIVRQKLKDLCNIKKILKIGKNSLHTQLNLESIDNIISAIKNFSGYVKKAGHKVSIEKPSTVLRLIVAMKQFASFMIYFYEKENNVTSTSTVRSFLNIFSVDCVPLEGNSRIVLKRYQYNAKIPIPITSDLITIKHYCLKVIKDILNKKQINQDTYNQLRQAILVRLILFNKRRGNEISGMKIEDYENEIDWLGTASEEAMSKIKKNELKKAQGKKLIKIEGKCRNRIYIQIPKDVQKGLNILLKSRKEGGIEKRNKYVFASSGGVRSRIRGTDSLRNIKSMLELVRPASVTTTNLRKHAASTPQSVNMTENEQDLLANHLGHDIRTHRKYYRQAEEVSEMTTVGKMLDLMDEGKLMSWRGEEREDNFSTNEPHAAENKKQKKAQKRPREDETPSSEPITPPKRRKFIRNPFSPRSQRYLIQKYRRHIKDKTLPGKVEIEQTTGENETPSPIKRRTWEAQKNFLRSYAKRLDRLASKL